MKKDKLILALFTLIPFTIFLNASDIKFPSNYNKGILYFKNDRGNITEEIFVDKEVIKKVKENKPIPKNTVITLVEYFAQNKKGSDGFALKGDLKRYVVMKRLNNTSSNGGWEYKVFNSDKSINTNENPNRCISCHSSQKNNEFVFTYDDMKNYDMKD